MTAREKRFSEVEERVRDVLVPPHERHGERRDRYFAPKLTRDEIVGKAMATGPITDPIAVSHALNRLKKRREIIRSGPLRGHYTVYVLRAAAIEERRQLVQRLPAPDAIKRDLIQRLSTLIEHSDGDKEKLANIRIECDWHND
jgi:hypothetical protein